MVKEFCIQYRVYAPGDKQYDDDLAVIKIKDGDKITEKENIFVPFEHSNFQKSSYIGSIR